MSTHARRAATVPPETPANTAAAPPTRRRRTARAPRVGADAPPALRAAPLKVTTPLLPSRTRWCQIQAWIMQHVW